MTSIYKIRLHPIEILRYIWRYLFLLIFPLLRGFFYAIQGDFAAWISGTWFDIVVVLLILAIGVVHWLACRFTVTSSGLFLEKGILFRQKLIIPVQRIATISLTDSFFLKPFKAVQLRADTPGGNHSKADFHIFVRRCDGQSILRCYEHLLSTSQTQTIPQTYRPRNLYILALSAVTSNSFAGIVILAAFISQSGRILGERFQESLYGTFEGAARSSNHAVDVSDVMRRLVKEELLKFDGTPLCQRCYDECVSCCDMCDEEYWANDLQEVEIDGVRRFVCPECAARLNAEKEE